MKEVHNIFFIFILFNLAFESCIGKKEILKTENTINKIVLTDSNTNIKIAPDPFSSLVEMDTEFGAMKIELFFETGTHRENFIKLAKNYV